MSMDYDLQKYLDTKFNSLNEKLDEYNERLTKLEIENKLKGELTISRWHIARFIISAVIASVGITTLFNLFVHL